MEYALENLDLPEKAMKDVVQNVFQFYPTMRKLSPLYEFGILNLLNLRRIVHTQRRKLYKNRSGY